jgi:hypothetical protein
MGSGHCGATPWSAVKSAKETALQGCPSVRNHFPSEGVGVIEAVDW